MEWLLSLLPWPLYYATVGSFLLSCVYLFGWDAWRLLDRLAERRLRLQLQILAEDEAEGEAARRKDAMLGSGLLLPRALSTVSSEGGGAQDEWGDFAYLDKRGKWKAAQVEFQSDIESVVVLRKLPEPRSATQRTQQTVPLESLQRISLEELDIGSGISYTIVSLHTEDTKVTLRTRAPEAAQWIQGLLEQLLRVRPKLATTPRPPVSEESITEKLKLVCEAEAPSFSIDLLALLLREFGVFAKRADLKNHLQRTTGKIKLETYRETVDAVKDIMAQLDGPEIFQRYATAHSNGNLVTVTDFHRFATESQGLLQHSLPETLRLLRSLATSDADLLDLGLVTRRVFRTALVSKLYTLPLKSEQLELRQPLVMPLTDYFISTSHNTYLMEDQIKGRSDCLAYEIALKKNCRCIELDIHNGPNNDPIITHGGTMTTKIRFEDVIKTIKRFAFVASEYPLILSFENHCGLEQQDRMAQILTTHLKEYLYFDEASDHMERLPCPEDLKRKIIIKNKKIHPHPIGFSAFSVGPSADADAEDETDDESDNEVQLATGGRHSFTELSTAVSTPTSITSASTLDDDVRTTSTEPSELAQSSSPTDSSLSLTRRYSSDKAGRDIVARKNRKKLKVSQALSDLVSICRPVKFKGQKYARENYRPVEMSSLGESKLDKRQWLKKDGEDANKLVLHSQYQLVRVYPSGLRTNSSNYNPITAWRFGCQMAALNYQTRCENMEINDGLFQLNGACGYVPKPGILSDPGTRFNPLAPGSDLARCLRLEIVSGACLGHAAGREKEAEEKAGLSPYVKVTLFGVPGDEKKDQTKKADQGFNPRWNYRCFDDNKIVKVPDLAHLRLEAKDKISGKVIGQFTAPLTAFSQGYRRVFLKDSKDVPTSSELWINFELTQP